MLSEGYHLGYEDGVGCMPVTEGHKSHLLSLPPSFRRSDVICGVFSQLAQQRDFKMVH